MLKTARFARPRAAPLLALGLLAVLAGCHSVPPPPPPSGPLPVGERVRLRFDHAVGLINAGNTTQAEAELRDVILLAPQLASPYIDLGILYRKAGRLDDAEEILRSAVSHNDKSAMAWTELGYTQRLRGEFRDAADSYEKAIAADPGYAPAYRNLGVVTDLYLGDADRALSALERYKELTGEDKPVSNWIAELRVRMGKPVKPASTAPAAPAAPAAVSDSATAAPRADN
jgi:Flp pilus assembly protein TadD